MSSAVSFPILLVLAWNDDISPTSSREGTTPPILSLLRPLADKLPLLAILPHLNDELRLWNNTDLASIPEAFEPTPPYEYSEAIPQKTEPTEIVEAVEHTTLVDIPLPKPLPAPPLPGVVRFAAHPIVNNARHILYQSRIMGLVEAIPTALQDSWLPSSAILKVDDHSGSSTPFTTKKPLSLRRPLRERQALSQRQAPAEPYQGRSEAVKPRSKEAASVSPPLDLAQVLTPQTFPPSLSDSAPIPPVPAPGLALAVVPTATPQITPPASYPDLEPELLPLLALEDGDSAQQTEERFIPIQGPDLIETTNLLVPSPARATLAQGLAALSVTSLPSPSPFALANDLHYRIIQYARFAAPLVEKQAETIGIIYAADWPTWLAALELRNKLRCPLVLQLTSLAADEAGPAERGWLLELERSVLRRAHTVLVPTEALGHRIRAVYGTTSAEIRVVAPDNLTALEALLKRIIGN